MKTASTLLAAAALLLSLTAPATQAQTFEILFSDNAGANPHSGLVQGSDGAFYGTTQQGGVGNLGTVFKITTAGVQTVLHSFNGSNGKWPSAELVQGGDGDFYGTTNQGGANNYGTVFKITPGGVHTVLHSFNSTDGRDVENELVLGSDGAFYGTTVQGGANGLGTVFKISASGVFTLLHSFNGTLGSGPRAGLVQGADGAFYGTTAQGGDGYGVVFKITSGGAFTHLHSFGSANGSPWAALTPGGDGNFYGTTAKTGGGSVFKITPGGVHDALHTFTGPNGSYPLGRLVLGGDGAFYGTNLQGGTNGHGTIYKVTPGGIHTVLHHFNSTNGSNPYAGLALGGDGDFYGTTYGGGANSKGTVFKITAGGVHTELHGFNNLNGRNPYAGLVQDSDGDFYGTTYNGGAHGHGTIFKIASSGTRSVLHSFNGINGRYPYAGLVQGTDGDFYGTTDQGGASGHGTVFKISASGTHTLLHSFNGGNGRNPYAELIQGTDGDFYGTTLQGGASDRGTVFRITASGTHTVLLSFNGTNGSYPHARLIQGTDGDFYSTTQQGGLSGSGTVFKITASGTHTLLHSFNGSNGRSPYAELIQGTDGDFYSTTQQGGVNSLGTVFKITASGTHTLLHSFDGSNGSAPFAGLVRGSDGDFYGTTANGGYAYGTIFKISPGGGHTVLHSFDGSQAASPLSTPVFGSDGNLYGTADLMVVWKVNLGTPEIAVSGNGVGIENGDATPEAADHTDFGAVLAGAGAGSLARTFTIINNGAADLALTGAAPDYVTLTGSAAFSVSLQPASATVDAGGGTQTFQITFAPATPGPHSAVVSIANDDQDPFTFTVAGVGAAAGSLSLSSAVYASSGGAVLNVTVQRTGGTAPVSVTLSTSDGSAGVVPPFTAAVAGTDYEALSTAVDFAEGETGKVVPVTLIPRAGKLPNRRFTVALSAPTGGAALGSTSSAEVRLLAPDTKAPSLAVRFPAASKTFITQVAPLLITGTAGDTLGLDRVEIDYGGDTFTATLGAASKPTSVPWSFEFTPPGDGPVGLEIRAYDLSWNVTTLTRNFDFIRRYPVQVTRQVPAGLSPPELAGTVKLSSSKGDFSALLPTKGALTQTGAVAPLALVTLTPKAAAGYAFSHWEGLPTGASTKGAVASFQMPAEDVTGITAVFVDNPFLGLGAKPVLYGLIYPFDDMTHNNATHGSLTAALTTSSGMMSGKVYLNGQTTAFTGVAFGNGSVWFRAPDKSLHTALALPGGAQMTGGFDHGTFIVEITGGDTLEGAARPAAYSKTDLVPAGLLNSATQGFYTAALPAKEQDPAKPLAEYPQGTGYGSITLKDNGTLRFAGVLADGTKYTAATALVTGDEAPVHAQLLTPGTTTGEKGGSLLGMLAFDPDAPDSDVAGNDLRWFRPSVVEQPGTTTAALATQLYTEGWPQGILLDLIGAKYDKTATAQTTLGFSAGAPGLLAFSEGGLGAEVEAGNFSLSGNAVTKVPATDKSFSLSFTQSTGLMRGTFTPGWPSAKLPAFTGVLLGKGANRGGWGYFLGNQTGDTDPESGAVTLEEYPFDPVPGFSVIPGGTFQMGDSLDGDPYSPVHPVHVSTFYLQTTEVSHEEWVTVRTWGLANGYPDLPVGQITAPDHPASDVNWYDALKWCNARSEMEGLTPCYHTDTKLLNVYRTGVVNVTSAMVRWAANGHRLPTEAEWEKGARGGVNGRRFPWGDIVSHTEANFFNILGEPYQTGTTGLHPVYSTAPSQPFTNPVAAFGVNGYGLKNTSGNVMEWCWDWFALDYYGVSPAANPAGPVSGVDKVIRGGSYGSEAGTLRCAWRGVLGIGNAPSMRQIFIGFRTARSR